VSTFAVPLYASTRAFQDNRKLRKVIRQLKQRCDDLQVLLSTKVELVACELYCKWFNCLFQAQNDVAAAAVVGGGLEETLMGVEEYGSCLA
jgi:hypothetical protein